MVSMRLGSQLVVHAATSCGWTACGVLYGSVIYDEVVNFVFAVETEDPVDCMSCLVQETRSPTIIETTFVLEPDR